MTTPPQTATATTHAPSFTGLATEPAALGTGFGNDEDAGAAHGRRPAAATLFDVCHVGVVLRAVLFVHGVLAVGAAFVAGDALAWPAQFATASGVALPALLWWLLTVCAAQAWLLRLPTQAQWGVLSAWGAASALAPWVLWGWMQSSQLRPGATLMQALAVAATGAAMAAALFQWLRQRARLVQPAETNARLAELQSRIRPHFLFNTLNTAIALVRVDPSRAEAVLEDLAELFRVALSDAAASQRAVTLAEEVELARRYLAIEQIRFGERLQVRWELDPATDGARLPPLLLQPLVENAVKHGIEPAPQGGVLRVRTRVRHGLAEILVANSVPPQASLPGHGIALHNVRERLKLMHDVAAEFRAGRDGDVYRVRISVPL